jgi:hypothetical protein
MIARVSVCDPISATVRVLYCTLLDNTRREPTLCMLTSITCSLEVQLLLLIRTTTIYSY